MSKATILKPLRRAVICLALLTASMVGGMVAPLMVAPVQAQDQLRIAAVVNDDIISELDVFMRLRMAMLSAQLEDTEETRTRLLPQVLRNLIDDRLKMQEAERTGVHVNPADVEKRIDRLAERNNMTRVELETFLQSNGILIDAVADQITAELNWARLVQRTLRPRIVITDQEINEETARIEATQGQTEYKMYQIFLAVDAPDQESDVRDSAARLIEQLRAGADFESLAQEFSQDEGALKGGNWGWLRLDQMEPAVAKLIPAARPLPFGHLGDGNIHYNVNQPEGADKAAFIGRWDDVNAVVFAVVAKFGGSISAEHGVGIMKRDLLPRVKDPVALDLMRTLKRTLDPKGILNPGKVL